MANSGMNRRNFVATLTGACAGLKELLTPRDAVGAEVLSTPVAGATKMPAIHEPSFPLADYTPFGYLDNPAHSAVMNRSGVLRSVPPLGFGWWARRLLWPYGEGAHRPLNYLSFLHLTVAVDGTVFHNTEDFEKQNASLVSRYHTKNLMSYDWKFGGAAISIQYVLSNPDALLCKISVQGESAIPVTVHATNIYGFPEEPWWGCDGIAAVLSSDPKTSFSKIWAYGDIFALSADRSCASRKATASAEEWDRWMKANDGSSNQGASAQFPGAIYTTQSYPLSVARKATETLVLCLARDTNQGAALSRVQAALKGAPAAIQTRISDDHEFYGKASVLTGSWPSQWKNGWIYDFETLRMTARPPLGIYKHHWDGMQIFTPRAVLGETMLDAMALSYGDIDLAKDMILGTFADAPEPNVPCSREDGSMNMICSDGDEVGTAPTWGMPFRVIRSIYNRDQDDAWIRALYPHMKSFLEWWLKHRTDENGWFHCKCSWESGQDASKRFLVAEGNPAAVSDFVRTVDVEAAMAESFQNMILFSTVAGHPADTDRWRSLAEKRIATTRAMYVDGWFRDFDSRNDKPIILKDYYDVMMLYPLAAGIATEEQFRAIAPRFKYFADNPMFWLEWPSFLFPFSEGAWNAGLQDMIGRVIASTGNRVYARTDARKVKAIPPFEDASPEAVNMYQSFPEQFRFRMPGVANEFWAIEDSNPGGCENYGWGATLPMLIIRNVVGFREFDDSKENAFRLGPSLPKEFLKTGESYGITNLRFRTTKSDVQYEVAGEASLKTKLIMRGQFKEVTVRDGSGAKLASAPAAGGQAVVSFPAVNGKVYTVHVSA